MQLSESGNELCQNNADYPEFAGHDTTFRAIHCHKAHHTMNAMGHDVKTFIGVNQRDLVKPIRKLVPDYMQMGSAGMAEMGEMEMPMPDNTLPMMTGFGQFGPLEMGGMFSVVKVREGLDRDDYKDPGWYKHPAGTVAYEFQDPVPEAPSRKSDAAPGQQDIEVTVVKPGRTSHTSEQH